jgi:glycosyltransferase involved in cell wall biosynthesis
VTVLHVAAGNAYGGIERMLVTLAGTGHPAIAQRFALSFAGRFARELQEAGAVVHRLPTPRAARPLMIWRARRAFAAVLESAAPDVVIFHGAWPHAMFAAAARASGVRIGFWQHQPIARPAWPDRWARRVTPDFTLFNSAFTQARPAFAGVPGVVIHCPVAAPPEIRADERRTLRDAFRATDDDVVVLMAARLEKWKGHEVLLEAVRLAPANARLRVVIAGGVQKHAEEPYYRRLASLAGGSELTGAVTLLGERDDVPALMRAADVYCQPNLRGEPFGIAIAEAMRAGLPCVISAAGGAAELLDETCAFVTAPGDAAAVSAALQRLAGDSALRKAMGRAAAVRASRLTDPAGRLEELAAVLAGRAP